MFQETCMHYVTLSIDLACIMQVVTWYIDKITYVFGRVYIRPGLYVRMPRTARSILFLHKVF
jgi:hypothetical protein